MGLHFQLLMQRLCDPLFLRILESNKVTSLLNSCQEVLSYLRSLVFVSIDGFNASSGLREYQSIGVISCLLAVSTSDNVSPPSSLAVSLKSSTKKPLLNHRDHQHLLPGKSLYLLQVEKALVTSSRVSILSSSAPISASYIFYCQLLLQQHHQYHRYAGSSIVAKFIAVGSFSGATVDSRNTLRTVNKPPLT